MTPFPAIADAFRRLCDGYVPPPESTHEAADALWVRLVTEGRVVDRVSDRGPRHYRTQAALVEHPALPAGEVYAVIGMGDGTLSVYRARPDDVRLAIQHPSAFNL